MERKKLIRIASILGSALLVAGLIVMAMGGPEALRGRKEGCFLRGTLRKGGETAAQRKTAEDGAGSGFSGIGQIVRINLTADGESECRNQFATKCAEWVGGWGYVVEKLEGTWDPGTERGPAIDFQVDGKCALKILRKRD